MIPDSERVIQIMREVAAREIMPRFQRLKTSDIAEKRNASDLVTTADLEAERHLTAALTALEPDAVVVGEESTEGNAALLSLLGGEKPVWVIDPVDGTLNYARGRACFAVIVAFCVKGNTLGGWILDPVSNEVVHAIAGQGAWLTDPGGRQQLRVAVRRDVGDMMGSAGRRLARLVTARQTVSLSGGLPKMVKYGCTGREYMDLARGTLDFAHYVRLKPWDHAAGVLIHAEAGGVSRLMGSRTPYRPRPQIMEETILLAPDEASWEQLFLLFNQV